MKAFIPTLLTVSTLILVLAASAQSTDSAQFGSRLGGRRWIATDAAVGPECRERTFTPRA
jgi:hypothetical protein